MKVQKKHILVIAAVVVVALLLLVAAFLLVRGIMQFNDSEARLNEAKSRLKGLYDEKPFPSQQNVAKVRANVNLLNEWYQKLTASLRKGQIEPVQKSPSTFMSLLQSKKPELIQQANVSGKVVADNFGFGFERYYTSSALPDPNDVPRLTQQLMIMEKLCGVLFSEKIESLVAVVREEFEEGGGAYASAGRPGVQSVARTARTAGSRTAGPGAVVTPRLVNKSAGLMEENDLYAKFHFILERSEERRVGKECRSRWSPYH